MACALALLSACQEAPAPVVAPSQPIIQNNQIRYPADHPQLALLTTQDVKTATDLKVELPAKLVWNEERTQRIYPAFSGRVVGIHVDLGQAVQVGSRLAQLASPEFGMAQADAARAQAMQPGPQQGRARLAPAELLENLVRQGPVIGDIEGAGGHVFDVHGSPLRYGKADVLNPFVIASAAPFAALPMQG